MLIECSNCGAPLDVKDRDTLARCCYCGKTQRVRTARTTMQHTPANWQPPPQWVPPPQYPAQSVPLRFDPSKTVRKVVVLIAVISIVTGIVPIACVVFFIAGAAVSSTSSPSRSDPDPPARPAKSRPNDVCLEAKACCEIATPQTTEACEQLAQVNDPKMCRDTLRGFQEAARAQGRSCPSK